MMARSDLWTYPPACAALPCSRPTASLRATPQPRLLHHVPGRALADAVDLAWKLDAVLAGWSGDNLLASYHAERRPVGERAVRMAKTFYKNNEAWRPDGDLDEAGTAGEHRRREAGERLVAHLGREFRTVGLQIGYRYEHSPIVVADGTPEGPDNPEDRAPALSRVAAAKAEAWKVLGCTGAPRTMLPWLLDEVAATRDVFQGEPFAYGLERNRSTLETLVDYLHLHHMIARRPPLEELFVDVGE